MLPTCDRVYYNYTILVYYNLVKGVGKTELMKRNTDISAYSTVSKVTITSYSGDNVRGVVNNDYYNKSFLFSDLFEMVKILESLYTSMFFPQHSFDERRFTNKSPSNIIIRKADEIKLCDQAKATFILHIKFRQNATWQGSINWVEENKTQNFRSTLEMIKLIDEALAEKGSSIQISWEDENN